jgi:hypothetical protein
MTLEVAMSDGPHRSLKMRPGWKKAAEFADNPNCTPEDVGKWLIPALGQDWRAEVPDSLSAGICEIFGSQDSLFSDQKVMQLDAFRRMTAGLGFSQVLIDCAVQLASEDKSGPAAVAEAADRAVAAWAARCARQVEEHYYRESNVPRALNVRARLEGAIRSAASSGLGRQLIKLEPGTAPRTPSKESGLDDGVRL